MNTLLESCHHHKGMPRGTAGLTLVGSLQMGNQRFDRQGQSTR